MFSIFLIHITEFVLSVLSVDVLKFTCGINFATAHELISSTEKRSYKWRYIVTVTHRNGIVD